MSDDTELAVKVDKVYKDFKLPHKNVTSIKTAFTNIFNSHAFGETEMQHALRDISFEVKKGEFFGIVGRNGSGKSTMLKILAGIYQPTKGKSWVKGKLVPFIELGVGFNGELTGRENVYLNGALLGFSRKQISKRYESIVRFAELEKFMDQKLKNYSSGMQVRLAFSVAVMAEADILLVDEVLAVGDSAFQRKCYEYFKKLKREGKTVIFVSHDMNAVREFCDRAILIEKSKLEFAGKPSDIAREYSMLFMENSASFAKFGSKRWGTADATFEDVKLDQKDNEIFITADVKVNKKVENMLYGIHVLSGDGKELTAMNNRMLGVEDVLVANKGTKLRFNWKMLNIFNDGTYTVSLTLADSKNNTLDWYNDAALLVVKRLERSTTDVLPPVSVECKIIK